MSELYNASILNLNKQVDLAQYELLRKRSEVVVNDRITAHIEELLLCRNPLLSLQEIQSKGMVKEYAGDDLEKYGVWVHYPWNNTLLHILGEEEFVEVRTNRNKNKITKEEQDLFSTKTVGIAGLSVGRSAALTLATERLVGKLVLADFDVLELSNLNRIKAPLSDLGLNKCVSVAREIAMLDPYIQIECYTEGLTEDNMAAFFGESQSIDLFIEECDSLEIKINSRIYARSKGIPVVMEASDRCLVDIERFDLEPDRPILHGILDDDDISHVGSLKTFEEKLKLMSKIVDVNQVTDRMLASLPEIGRSLRTWPQLASDVTFGGGVMTKLIRAIFTDTFRKSGRYYLDSTENVLNN